MSSMMLMGSVLVLALSFEKAHSYGLKLKSVGTQDIICPGSKAAVHAGMKLSTTCEAKCEDVEAEAKARAEGQQGWVDPHNRGTYTVANLGGNMSFMRRTGDDKYTDAMIFTLTNQNGKCKIDACSESQGGSYGDVSTNYCNLEMLFCGSSDNCHPILHNFEHGVEQIIPIAGGSSNRQDCFNGPQAR